MLNNGGPRNKTTGLERQMNRDIIWWVNNLLFYPPRVHKVAITAVELYGTGFIRFSAVISLISYDVLIRVYNDFCREKRRTFLLKMSF